MTPSDVEQQDDSELNRRLRRRERRLRLLSGAVFFGSPVLAASITTGALWLDGKTPLTLGGYDQVVAGLNAGLAALGSAAAVFIEPGGTTASRIAAVVGGAFFGFSVYMLCGLAASLILFM